MHGDGLLPFSIVFVAFNSYCKSVRSILREKNCNFTVTHLLYAIHHTWTQVKFLFTFSYRNLPRTRCHPIQITFTFTRKKLAALKRFISSFKLKCKKKKELHSPDSPTIWLLIKQSINNLNEFVRAFENAHRNQIHLSTSNSFYHKTDNSN